MENKQNYTKEQIQELNNIMQNLMSDYDNKPADISEENWIEGQLKKYLAELPEEARQNAAAEILESIKTFAEKRADIEEYCNRGNSKEQWFAEELSKAAANKSVLEYGKYLTNIDKALFYNDVDMEHALIFGTEEEIRRQQQLNILSKTAVLDDVDFNKPVKNYAFREVRDAENSVKLSKKLNVKDASSWNSYKNRDLALGLGKKIAYCSAGAAAISVGADVLYKFVNDEKVDAKQTMKLAVMTGADAGAKTVVATSLKIGAQKGILPAAAKGISNFGLGAVACIAVENAKVAYKVAKGELSATKGLDEMGKTTCSAYAGFIGAAEGAALVATAAASVVAPPLILGLSGIIAAIAGCMTGSAIGRKIYEGGKKIAKAAGSFLKSAANKVGKVADKIWNKIFG